MGSPYSPLTPLSMEILLSLADRERHGYALLRDVRDQSAGLLCPRASTLYAALERLRTDGLIVLSRTGKEPPAAMNRRILYQITPFGRRLVAAEARRLRRVLQLADDKRVTGTPPGDLPALGDLPDTT